MSLTEQPADHYFANLEFLSCFLRSRQRLRARLRSSRCRSCCADRIVLILWSEGLVSSSVQTPLALPLAPFSFPLVPFLAFSRFPFASLPANAYAMPRSLHAIALFLFQALLIFLRGHWPRIDRDASVSQGSHPSGLAPASKSLIHSDCRSSVSSA